MSKVIHLQEHDYNVDGIYIHAFNFPDGTRHIKLSTEEDIPNEITLIAKPKNNDEFMDIILTADALRRMGVTTLHLVFPYVFGCRQDRVCIRGEPLSTRVYADLINSCHFASVRIWDPHSDVISGILNNCIPMPGIGHEVIKTHFADLQKSLTLVSPDAGASKKVWEIARELQIPMIQCDKHRELATGRILAFKVNCKPEEVCGRDLLIIDDCVTNGGTFLGLKTELIKLAPRTVSLCVTHADHLTGLQNMSDNFDRVFVSDSRDGWRWSPANLHVIALNLGDTE